MIATDAAALTSVPISRFQTLTTSAPNSIRDVASAKAPNHVKHSNIVVPPSATPPRWSNTHTAAKPRCSAISVASRNSGHVQWAGLSWISTVVPRWSTVAACDMASA
jgi:hypothetical protein